MALDFCVDWDCSVIYTEEEFDLVRQKRDKGRYLPYTHSLWQIQESCLECLPEDRPDIFLLWELSRKRVEQWEAVVRKNRQIALEQGKEFYYGMVLCNKKMRERLLSNKNTLEEFRRETEWAAIYRDRVEKIKSGVKG
jgi:hypothetical protein